MTNESSDCDSGDSCQTCCVCVLSVPFVRPHKLTMPYVLSLSLDLSLQVVVWIGQNKVYTRFAATTGSMHGMDHTAAEVVEAAAQVVGYAVAEEW